MNKDCDVCAILNSNNDDIVIAKTKFWRVALEQNQAYLGQAFVTLLNHKSSLSQLSSDEWEDFASLADKLEQKITKVFGAKHYNWTCLMNEAYRKTPASPHVHWHIFPRYERPVIVNGITFEDTEFGHHYIDRKFKTDKPTLEMIGSKLKN